jgi:LysR family glycine cleavage system transcriptional activator
MARNLPPLNALKAFEAAARHESFTAAAAELNVTHAAISRHIRELEGWLGTKLFVRTGRGVELTERGKGYVIELTRGFDILAAATEIVSSRRRRRRQQLGVSVEPSFAALWLVPRLGRFTAANPDSELVLESANRLVDFARDQIDVGIRYGRGVWSGVAADLLTRTHMAPVCSPALLEATGIRTPEQLQPGLLLKDESRRYWDEWLTAAGVADRISPEGPTLGLHLTIPAAEAGQGFSLADEVIAGDALVGGRLVRPFATAIDTYGYYFVRGADRKETRAMTAFHVWIAAEISDTLDAVVKATPAAKSERTRRPSRQRS